MTFLKTLFSAEAKKALVALSASVIGVVALFTQVDPTTPAAVAGVLLAILNFGGVFFATNTPTFKR